MRLNFECLLSSFPYSLRAVFLPVCVGTCAEGSWLGILQTLRRSRCAVLRTVSDPETTDYEIPVGQTEWTKQKRNQRGYPDSALLLLSIVLNWITTRGRPHRCCGSSPSLIGYYKQHVTSGIHMLWLCRKLSWPPKRKCGHRFAKHGSRMLIWNQTK